MRVKKVAIAVAAALLASLTGYTNPVPEDKQSR